MFAQLDLFPLDVPSERLEALEALLDPGERERAARFLRSEDRRRFVAAHGRLRELLGDAIGEPPERVAFETDSHGKPRLLGARAGQTQFNLSHSQGWGLVGCTAGRRIGVDVEAWRPLSDRDRLAERYFSARELRQYSSCAVDRRQQLFYQCWVRKEAVLKADGRGLALPLDSFDVDAWDAGPCSLARSPPLAPPLILVAPDLPPGVSAALALEGGEDLLGCALID